MIFNLEDKFVVSGGIIGVVKYINNGNAWLCPAEDAEINEEHYQDKKLLLGCVFTVVNAKGITTEGTKVKALNNTECQAV